MYTVTFILRDSGHLVHLTYDKYEEAMKCADECMRGKDRHMAFEDDYKTTTLIVLHEIMSISISHLESQLKLQTTQKGMVQAQAPRAPYQSAPQ